MPSQTGLSGITVGVLGLGGVLVYAGFRGVNPIQALRDIGSGKPVGVSKSGTSLDTPIAGLAGQIAQNYLAANGDVAGAAAKYETDRYSQARRTEPGWSDCSSFCDKILTDIGVPPPVKWASTSNYRLSATWKTIPAGESLPGDVAVSSHHMVMVLAAGGTAAIGQQNPRVNVRRGSVKDLMGRQSYAFYRYNVNANPFTTKTPTGLR